MLDDSGTNREGPAHAPAYEREHGFLPIDDEFAVCQHCPVIRRELGTPLAVELRGHQEVIYVAYADGAGSPWFVEPAPCLARGQVGYIPPWYWKIRPLPSARERSERKHALASLIGMFAAAMPPPRPRFTSSELRGLRRTLGNR